MYSNNKSQVKTTWTCIAVRSLSFSGRIGRFLMIGVWTVNGKREGCVHCHLWFGVLLGKTISGITGTGFRWRQIGSWNWQWSGSWSSRRRRRRRWSCCCCDTWSFFSLSNNFSVVVVVVACFGFRSHFVQSSGSIIGHFCQLLGQILKFCYLV